MVVNQTDGHLFTKIEPSTITSKNKGKPTIKVDLPYFVAGSRIELPTSGL